MSEKKILIISYTFPPNNGIGGRRWAKFTKELVKLNHDVKVLTFNNRNREHFSNWANDIASFEDNITYIPTNYPKWLDYQKGLRGKVLYKLSLCYVRIRAKGNYYDRASFLREKVIHKVDFFIKQGYNNVIVSCAPFKLALWISELIPKYLQVNFIVDFRDPWTNNLTAYGLSSMSKDRIDSEHQSEKRVLNSFHKIIVVAEEMSKYFIDKYSISKEKISVISNGFDEDDFKNVSDAGESYLLNKNKIKIVFAGTFYDNADYLLEELADILKSNKEFLDIFEFHFFGAIPLKAKNIIEVLPANFYCYGFMEVKHVYSIISKADFCSLFLTKDINYSLSTKFLEYLSQGKKIIVFSNEGYTSKFVEKNNLGVSAAFGKMSQALYRLIEMHQKKDNKIDVLSESFLNDFNVKHLIKKVERLLV